MIFKISFQALQAAFAAAAHTHYIYIQGAARRFQAKKSHRTELHKAPLGRIFKGNHGSIQKVSIFVPIYSAANYRDSD
ncbi:MAG: hypothetical protein LBD21_08855 [Tannerellaceae bacterium]|jgi:hypothetical protein|nr:hypothetical protein [Tannerellaceae bacterium]